jgi:hypothetical protein
MIHPNQSPEILTQKIFDNNKTAPFHNSLHKGLINPAPSCSTEEAMVGRKRALELQLCFTNYIRNSFGNFW